MRRVFGDLDVVVGRSVVVLVLAGVFFIANVGGAIAVEDDSVGLVDPSSGLWHVENPDGSVASFYYGNPGDVPFMGDWDCDTVATPGLFRTSDAFAYLRNSNSQGIADIRFFFGNPSDIPLAGDFNGDGCDTLSIYRPSEARFYIMNELGENEGGLGAAEYSFLFGNPGDKPVVGDWDGDGIDEIGLHRDTTGFFYWRNTLDQGIAHGEIFFGDPGDRFVAGDWGVIDKKDSPAVYRPSARTFYFRHTLTQGNADSTSTWGHPTWLPVAGPAGVIPPPAGSETPTEFVPRFEKAIQTGDTAWLRSKIHPQALQVLGSAQCDSYFSDFAPEPGYRNTLKSSSAPTLWDSGYTSNPQIPNTYTLRSDITSFGNSETADWHAGLFNNELHWFPGTCDPPTPPICLDSNVPEYNDIYIGDFVSSTESTVLWLASKDGTCSDPIINTERAVVVAPSETEALQLCEAITGNPHSYTYNLRGAGYLEAPSNWYLCGPE